MGETSTKTTRRWARLSGVGLIAATMLLAAVTIWGIHAWDGREARARVAAELAADLTDQVRLIHALASEPETPVTALDAPRALAAGTVTRLTEIDADGVDEADLVALERSLTAFNTDVDAFLRMRERDGSAQLPEPDPVEQVTGVVRQSALGAADRADRTADVGSALGFVAAIMVGGIAVVRRSREGEPATPTNGTVAAALRGAAATGAAAVEPTAVSADGCLRCAPEHLLQPLIDSLPDRIAVKDANGRYARVNLAQAAWLGLNDPAEAIGRTERDFFPPPIVEQFAAEERRVLRTGDPELDRLESLPAGAAGEGGGWALVSRVPMLGAGRRLEALIETRRHLPTQPEVVWPSRLRDRAFAATSEGIAIVDAARPGTPIVDVNPAFERLTGFAADEAVGRTLIDVLLAGADQAETGHLRVAMAAGRETDVTVRLQRKDGETFWSEIHVSPVSVDGGPGSDGAEPFSHVVLSLKDIAERRQAERRFREAEAKYRTLVERNPAVTYAVRTGGGRPAVYVSPQVESMLGYPPSAWRSDPSLRAKLVHPDDRQAWEAEVERSAATGQPFRLEYRLLAKGGRVVWVRDEAVLVTDDEGQAAYWQGFLLDVSDRKSLQERLEHRAFVDPLTNLPTRDLLLDRLQNALARAGRANRVVGLLYVDLDDFATVNDGMGRQIGDQVLKAVGRRLENCVRRGDTVARLAADAYGILLDELHDPGEATRIAERIVEALRASLRLNRGQVFVTGSVGVVRSRSAGDAPGDLLRDAEAAMREAKRRGKDRHAIFEAGMSSKTWARLDLELELRRGIDNGEFLLHYQPVVALDTGRIREVEALVRWQHPERGLVGPGEFMPLAEETGLILPLGRHVLELGCRQVRAWQSADPQEPPLVLCVNVSGQQFRQPEFAEEVGRILLLTGIDPGCLKLEIAETVAAADADATAAKMAELKALGVRLAIDEFGAGTASMSYLEQFPIDALKIDRIFSARLGPLGDDPAMVRAVIAFAKTLNLSVTAEGVETGEQLRRLRELGCDLGQGHHFTKPLPVAVMADLLAAAPRWLDARAAGATTPVRQRPIGVGTGLLPAAPAIPVAS